MFLFRRKIESEYHSTNLVISWLSSLVQELYKICPLARKLSISEIKIPNVIRNSVPEQIVKQYGSYCVETGFSSPLRRSSLCRILDVCSASTRTPLQGLDYFTAEGGKAFDDMVAVVEELGDV